MKRKLAELLTDSKDRDMSEIEKEDQRRSFVYGNTKIENDHITRETVADVAKELAQNDASAESSPKHSSD